MTIFCFGSINIDHVHRVPHFPAAGETLSDLSYSVGLGGKGANQAVAAARCGGRTCFVGAVGADGGWTRDALERAGIDTRGIATVEDATGHAVIYVDGAGENSIVIHGGANRAVTETMIADALSRASPGDWWLTQNETALVPESIEAARKAGLRTAYSAAPFDPVAAEAVLPHLDLLAVNEGEARALRDRLGGEPDVPMTVTTLGAEGARLTVAGEAEPVRFPAFEVDAVDTTGAGDTFIGSFVGTLDRGAEPREAAVYALAAAALSVTRPGAAEAIPTAEDVVAFLKERR